MSWHILRERGPSSQWQMFIKERKEKAKPWNPYWAQADLSPLHFQSDKCSKPPRGRGSSSPVGRKEESVLNLILPNTLQNEVNLFFLQGRRQEQARPCISGNTPVFYTGILELLLSCFQFSCCKKKRKVIFKQVFQGELRKVNAAEQKSHQSRLILKTWQPWQPPCSSAEPHQFCCYPWLQNWWMKWNGIQTCQEL